jgi:hypothetical protein
MRKGKSILDLGTLKMSQNFLIIVRDRWGIVSPKAQLIAKIIEENYWVDSICLVRDQTAMFRQGLVGKKIELPTSTISIFLNYFLTSPEDFRNAIIRRISNNIAVTMVQLDFVSAILRALKTYFVRASRIKNLTSFLENTMSQKVFLIDEYMSIKTIDPKYLKKNGFLIYVSQDIPSEVFDFDRNFIASTLMSKFEHQIMGLADLVIASSNRDCLRYVQNGAKNVIYYPNIYPIVNFHPANKDEIISISIVFRKHWGTKKASSLNQIFEALGKIHVQFKVYMIGMKPQNVPTNIQMEHYDFISDKQNFLKVISKSWIGINVGFHKGGSNERKYDYAMAGLVVFSDFYGSRGDLLPHEYTFLDSNDLAAKLLQLMALGKKTLSGMGLENREQALLLASEQYNKVVGAIQGLFAK